MRMRFANMPFLSGGGLLKHPFTPFGKIALGVGAFLFLLGLLLHLLIAVPGDNEIGLTLLLAVSLQGVIWGAIGAVFHFIGSASVKRLRDLKQAGKRYEAEITNLTIVPGINVGIHTPTVFAECIYMNDMQQRCKVRSKMFLWESLSHQKLKAVVYTDWNDPSRYAVEITKRDDLQPDVDIDYT